VLSAAIGLVLTGCPSAASTPNVTDGINGTNGTNGTNALPAQTATTVEGVKRFFEEDFTAVYLVGEITLRAGDTLTIPDGCRVIMNSIGDLNSRVVATDGFGKITLAGGTLIVGSGGSLIVWNGSKLAVQSGSLDVRANASVSIKAGAVLAVTGGSITTTGVIAIDRELDTNEASSPV
jgi:hypothetical protein